MANEMWRNRAGRLGDALGEYDTFAAAVRAAQQQANESGTSVVTWHYVSGSLALGQEGVWTEPQCQFRIVGGNLPQDVDSDGYDTREAAEAMASEYAEGEYRIESYRA